MTLPELTNDIIPATHLSRIIPVFTRPVSFNIHYNVHVSGKKNNIVLTITGENLVSIYVWLERKLEGEVK